MWGSYRTLLLLFVWNTLTVSMTVSTTIPLHQDPLGVDVAGLQGMQWVDTIQQCTLWSGGSLRSGKQVMRSRPIGGEIRRIWPGHISDDSVWRTGVSVEWIQVADTLDQSRDHVRVVPLESTTAPMSPAPFDLSSRVVQHRSRKAGEVWDATWVAHVGSPWWEHDPRELLSLLVLQQGSTVTANLWGLDVAKHRQPVDVGWS